MGLWDLITGGRELIERIEWVDPPRDVLAHRFTRIQNRVKVGAKLVVHDGQAVAVGNRGLVAGVYAPGEYSLDAGTLPESFGLRGGPRESVQAEVYFVSTALRTEVAWATLAPVIVRVSEVGPVRVQASGTIAFAVTDPAAFLREIAATAPEFQEYRTAQLHNVIVALFADILRTSNAPAPDLLGDRGWLGRTAGASIAAELRKMGVSVAQFGVKTVTLPPEVKDRLGLGSPVSFDGECGYRAEVPEPILPPVDPRPKGPAADGRYLVEFALSAPVPASGPASGRIPLSDVAPADIFPGARPPASGPTSGRYLLPEAGSVPGPAPLPPSLPPYLSFFVAINGAPAGPFDLLTVAARVREGAVTKSTLVWKPGMQGWAAAETVSELEPLFTIVPPPLPPQ